MARKDDDPAAKYDARTPRQRDRERPAQPLPEGIAGTSVDSTEPQSRPDGTFEHFDAATEQERRIRNVEDRGDDRAGAGGAPDQGPGAAGGTLGTDGTNRDWDH